MHSHPLPTDRRKLLSTYEAADYRDSDPKQLVGAIREVARGGSVIDPKVVETLVAALEPF